MDKDTNSKFTEKPIQWDTKLWKNPYENMCSPINNQDCTIKQQWDFLKKSTKYYLLLDNFKCKWEYKEMDIPKLGMKMQIGIQPVWKEN